MYKRQIVTCTVAELLVIVKLPVKLPELKSALVIPVIVYATVVASATFVVFKVNVTVDPSFTVAALLDKLYVAEPPPPLTA